ncbi:Lysozyme [Fusarium austroafricanum]|uniref:Lysozyme n=1 Tax=Fusarium austroafricanum TaxID=2364996 RepID=A0A8H4K0K0_9HYPO|nr:Lysozyme [Fusarium austroafricanum]
MGSYILGIHAVATSVARAFFITDEGVRCRSGPSTSYSIARQFSKDTDVTIICQTDGTNIEGNNIWDKTAYDCYVSDYCVDTRSSGYVTEKCGVCKAPRSNQATVNLIARFEGFRPDVYNDPTVQRSQVSNPTLCQKRKKLLANDMKEFEVCTTAMLNRKAKLNRNQYGALISWAFNMSCENAESSTPVRRLNNGEDPSTVISQELPQWVYASGQKLPGLVRRRNAEIELAKKPTRRKAFPKRC